MASDNSEEAMKSVNSNDAPEEEPEYMLFQMFGDYEWLRERLENVPRYLFRVVTPFSNGKTDETWVRSASATLNKTRYEQNIFVCRSLDIALMLNRHLQWKVMVEPDQVVSWTSSLAVAISYILYHKDKWNLHEIKLYVVDTTKFPTGTFMRDLDLIEAFKKEFDDYQYLDNLKDLWDERVNKGYYFGEYLTQCSLKIAGKCQMITGAMILDSNRLYTLQPYFEKSWKGPLHGEDRGLNKLVLDFRKIFLKPRSTISLEEMNKKIHVLKDIANLFAPGWKFSMAVYFAALMGKLPKIENHKGPDDYAFFTFFESTHFYDERLVYTLSTVKIISSKAIPEMRRVKEIFEELSKYRKQTDALRSLQDIEHSLAVLKSKLTRGNKQDHPLAFDSNPVLNILGEDVVQKLDEITDLCEKIFADLHK